ncbi:MAG: ABC transporter ATP-binding protein [Oscillospiraceae bacterium]|jgi:spermidine/putrescine transport system ATP-binding protein|nr:ABC transporter ATP-binding protein [Oscillospiraceae bacterium]
MVALRNITAIFGDHKVIDNLNLDIKDSEFVTLLGPSGCGKTTILRMIGGFLKPNVGDIFIEGKNVTNVPAHKRNVNTIFQSYALFPHLNVYENVAFGMRIQKKSEIQISSQVEKMLKMVSLENFSKRSVTSLSGGQQQRVAIARALVVNPRVLLLDEPFGALDLKLRKDMQSELKAIQQKTGITFVFVTHDQEEALSMSDVVIVMNEGKIQQIGTPTNIYNEPRNAFVADFIGESNILDGVMLEDYIVEFANKKFKCLDFGFKKNEKVDVVIRPEDVKIRKSGLGQLKGCVASVTFKGVHYEIIVDVSGFKWMIQSTMFQKVGSEIGIFLNADDIHIMRKFEHSGEYGDYSAFSDEMYEVYENVTK